ncbi:MAG TPA: M20/M25/M40 family metallo-hydrolase [Bryobacteraceae bacterium]|nr:M20/M25/M40 family metallo-hydrolase [Bryobacteraceae bacterium]
MTKKLIILSLFAAALCAEEAVDLAVVQRIKKEAFQNSKVMDHLFWLTDVYGPRLTGSPGFTVAANWAVKRLKEYGVEDAAIEPWGKFGRSWRLTKFSISLQEPEYAPLIGFPLAWSANTNGPLMAEPVLAPLTITDRLNIKKTEEEVQRFFQEQKGKLRGKIVLLAKPKDITPITTAPARRFSDTELAQEAQADAPQALPPFDIEKMILPEKPAERRAFFDLAPLDVQAKVYDYEDGLTDRVNQFLTREGAVAAIVPSYNADAGTVFGEAAGTFKQDQPMAGPRIALTIEHYNRIARLLDRKVPVKLELEVHTTSEGATGEGLNIIGNIPGGIKRDEIVMIGAHFDSWIGGTGATDNGTGSAVMIEVMRILRTLHLRLDRTVRLGLWSGEEEGLYGSRAYVKDNFADPATMQLKPAHAKLSGYFNHDNGTGKIRGVYLQENDAMRPVFEAWLAPLRDLGATTISIRNTGGTDHQSFDQVGLPGFQFIQDEVEYGRITHHSNMDVYDHAVPADLMQAAAVIASVVYNAANRAEMLPRKELPGPVTLKN